MHDETFLNIALRLEDIHGDLAFEAPFVHYCLFSLLEKAISKSSHHVLRFAAAYLQARNEPAGDHPRRDFWLIVSRSCACHSPQTVLATASLFAMLVLYQLLFKCTKCQYGELTVSLPFSAQENTRHAHCASVSRNLKASTAAQVNKTQNQHPHIIKIMLVT